MNDEIDEKFKRKLKIGLSIIMLIVSIFVYILLAFFMLAFDTKIYQLIFSIT